MKYSVATIFIVGMGFILFSCEEGGENETKISKFDSDESHNMGLDCMSCHISGGEGEGWFNIAGTVYDEQKTITLANATIKLTTGANGSGDLKHTIEGDKNGNFYTTETIDLASGLYVTVEGPTSSKSMLSKLSSGACNSCHGSTIDKIWAK